MEPRNFKNFGKITLKERNPQLLKNDQKSSKEKSEFLEENKESSVEPRYSKKYSYRSNDNTKAHKRESSHQKVKLNTENLNQIGNPYFRKSLKDIYKEKKNDKIPKKTDKEIDNFQSHFDKERELMKKEASIQRTGSPAIIVQNLTLDDVFSFQNALDIAYTKIKKLTDEKKTLMTLIDKLFHLLTKTHKYKEVKKKFFIVIFRLIH